jgi:hypothetical protein
MSSSSQRASSKLLPSIYNEIFYSEKKEEGRKEIRSSAQFRNRAQQLVSMTLFIKSLDDKLTLRLLHYEPERLAEG